ncbi:hypothetical protein LTR10_002504 [Elasticomyces elasticus]|nr:hypothetical protein LTR10_002504 [Elasticomyces elasticus]
MPPIHINGIGGRMIRDDQIGGSRRDSDEVVERLERTRAREERYGPPARDRFERPVEDRYSVTWGYIHEREYRSRRVAREAPRAPPSQSTHNDRVADGRITKPTTSSGRHAERKRERDRVYREANPPTFNKGEEVKEAVSGGPRSVKGEGDGNVTTSGDGRIIKAEDSENYPPMVMKQVKIEEGVVDDAKVLIKYEGGDQDAVKIEPLVKDNVAEKTKAEHVDTIKIKVEGSDD